MSSRVLPAPARRDSALFIALLIAFAALAYGPAIRLPFVADDYLFLDETLNASFTSLWSFDHIAFDWYRPWSREVHFWAVQQIAGLSPSAFRLFGMGLWLVALLLYLRLLQRIVPTGTARLATLGAASMAMWGTPLLWISGSQDLWMLVSGLSFVLLIAERRDRWASAALALALLSKETAAVLLPVAALYAVLVQGDSWKRAAVRILPSLGVVALWFAVHPTLQRRLLHPYPVDPELFHRLPEAEVAARNVLALVNSSLAPKPFEVVPGDVVRALLCAAVLGTAVWMTLGTARRKPGPRPLPPSRNAVLFLLGWTILGWVPTHAPSIGWHAYYGCVGALGGWALIAMFLSTHRAIATAALVTLALLRAADAKTLTWDWGNEWHTRRAGDFLVAIEQKLKTLHPTLPSSSRVFFGRLPNNIGLVAGSSSAIRVWYRDTTLSAGFYSSYRPRTRPGEDYFFRFDTVQVLTEVVAGSGTDPRERAANPEWAEDHVKLAMLFLGAREPARAADEFEKVWRLENRPQEALYAAACRRMSGADDRADSILRAFATQTGTSIDSARSLVSELERSAPGPH